MFCHFSAEEAGAWASGPLAVQASKVRGPQVTPGTSWVLPVISRGHVAAGFLPRTAEADSLPFLVLGNADWDGSRDLLGASRVDRAGTPARSPWRRLHSPGCCLWAAPPARSGGFGGRPAPRLQEGAELPGAADSSPRQRGLTGQPTGPGAARRPRGRSRAWTASSWRRWPPPWSGSSSAGRYVAPPAQVGPMAVVWDARGLPATSAPWGGGRPACRLPRSGPAPFLLRCPGPLRRLPLGPQPPGPAGLRVAQGDGPAPASMATPARGLSPAWETCPPEGSPRSSRFPTLHSPTRSSVLAVGLDVGGWEAGGWGVGGCGGDLSSLLPASGPEGAPGGGWAVGMGAEGQHPLRLLHQGPKAGGWALVWD